ncbi:MAG: acyl-CoA esterase [Gemmataceae bacterium]|nr:acyl-CoA esterase [Gemmataceae bacterium]
MFTERSIPAGRLRLNVAEGPKNGPPLWLFHGVGRRWQDFAPLLGSLSAQWTLRVCDHRGHGRSSHAPGCYFVSEYIADAGELVRDVPDPAVIVGHSLGALVALGVAASAPPSVRAIVLLDPPGQGFLSGIDATPYAAMWAGMRHLAGNHPVPEVARKLAELRLPGSHPGETVRLGDQRDAAALRFMARCLHDLDPGVLAPPLEKRWLDGFDPLAAARKVRCPALLVVADPDRGGMLPPADADPLTAALADRVRVDLPGVGHLIHWQDAPAALRLLHGFLGSL